MKPLTSRLQDKQARNIGLSSAELGAGPHQMEDAIRLYGQARTLARPTEEELKKNHLTRPQLGKSIDRLSSRSGERFSDARYSEPVHAATGAAVGGLTGAAIGYRNPLSTGSEAAEDPSKLIRVLTAAALGAATGYGGMRVGRQIARRKNSRLASAMRLLRGRGVLSPADLTKAAPLLTEPRMKRANDTTIQGSDMSTYDTVFNAHFISRLAGYKQAGPISELLSHYNPVNAVALPAAGLAALLTPTRTTAQMAKNDAKSRVLRDLLVPGVGPYNAFKRTGYAWRNPELKAEIAGVQLDRADKRTNKGQAKSEPKEDTEDKDESEKSAAYELAVATALGQKLAQDQSVLSRIGGHLSTAGQYLGKNPWAAAGAGALIAGLPALFRGDRRKALRNSLFGAGAGLVGQQAWKHRGAITDPARRAQLASSIKAAPSQAANWAQNLTNREPQVGE